MTNDELMSKTISYLRFPLTLGVLYIHATGCLTMQGTKYGEMESSEWYNFIIDIFSYMLPCISVPLFFMISGFLFFYKTDFDANTYRKKLKKRAVTLLIPYLIWNVLSILKTLMSALPFLSSFSFNASYKIDFSLSSFLMCFWDQNRDMFITPDIDGVDIGDAIYPINLPMWYVRDLMVIVILAPVIYILIKRLKWWFLLILCILWYLPFKWGYISQLYTALFFVSLGAYFSISDKNIVYELRKLKYIPCIYIIIVIIDLCTKQFEYNFYIYKTCILFGIVAAVNITSSLLERGKIRVNEFLASSAFFVYAFHSFIEGGIGRGIFIYLMNKSENEYLMILLYFIVPIITAVICLATYKLIKTYCPRMGSIITGGR